MHNNDIMPFARLIVQGQSGMDFDLNLVAGNLIYSPSPLFYSFAAGLLLDYDLELGPAAESTLPGTTDLLLRDP
jgi:hypothetical protein